MDFSGNFAQGPDAKEKKTAVNNSRTRTAKAKAQEEYTEVNREVKKSIKVDKRNYIDSLQRKRNRQQEEET